MTHNPDLRMNPLNCEVVDLFPLRLAHVPTKLNFIAYLNRNSRDIICSANTLNKVGQKFHDCKHLKQQFDYLRQNRIWSKEFIETYSLNFSFSVFLFWQSGLCDVTRCVYKRYHLCAVSAVVFVGLLLFFFLVWY